MSIIGLDGFDAYADAGQLALRKGALTWTATGAPALAAGRLAGRALALPDGATLTANLGAENTSPIVGAAVRLDAGAALSVSFLTDSTVVGRVLVGADGSIALEWNGQTKVQTAAHAAPGAGVWFYLNAQAELQPVEHGTGAPSGVGIDVEAGGYPVGWGTSDNALRPANGRGANGVRFAVAGGGALVDDFLVCGGKDDAFATTGGVAFDTSVGDRHILAVPAAGVAQAASFATVARAYAVQVVGLYEASSGRPVVYQRIEVGDNRTVGVGQPVAAQPSYLTSAFALDPATGATWDSAAGLADLARTMWYSAADGGTFIGSLPGGEFLEVLYTPGTPPAPPPSGGGSIDPPPNPGLPAFPGEAQITPWTIRPDWKDGISERLQWLTDVLISQDGSEQRRRLRQSPRRVIEAKFTIWADQRRLYDSYMAGPQAGVWRVPLWWERNALVLPAGPASASLSFHFEGSEIVAGDTVILLGDTPFACELALVAGVGPGGVVLATKLARSWPAGTPCYPTKRAVLVGSQSATRRSDDALQASLQFQVIEPNDYAGVVPAAYAGVPVLPHAPDWAADTTFEHQRMLALFDNDTGLLARRDTALRAFAVQQFGYTARGRAAASAFRATLHYLAGRLRPAWLPTFMRDFDLVPGGRHAAGSAFLTVRRSGYAELGTDGPVGSHTGRRVLMIAFRDGTLAIHAVTGYVLADAASETIQLDPPLDRLVSPDTVLRMSFCQVMRQDQDEVTLLHVTDLDGITQVTTTFRACDVVRRSDPYQAWLPGTARGFYGTTGQIAAPRPDRSEGTAPGTPPVVVDPVSLALTGGAG